MPAAFEPVRLTIDLPADDPPIRLLPDGFLHALGGPLTLGRRGHGKRIRRPSAAERLATETIRRARKASSRSLRLRTKLVTAR